MKGTEYSSCEFRMLACTRAGPVPSIATIITFREKDQRRPSTNWPSVDVRVLFPLWRRVASTIETNQQSHSLATYHWIAYTSEVGKTLAISIRCKFQSLCPHIQMRAAINRPVPCWTNRPTWVEIWHPLQRKCSWWHLLHRQRHQRRVLP